jgi:hypothetical protein
MFSFFRSIREFIEWRRRDDDDRVVATCVFGSKFAREDGTLTGLSSTHVATYWQDANGVRWTVVNSTDRDAASRHGALLKSKIAWRHCGKLPEGTVRAVRVATNEA